MRKYISCEVCGTKVKLETPLTTEENREYKAGERIIRTFCSTTCWDKYNKVKD